MGKRIGWWVLCFVITPIILVGCGQVEISESVGTPVPVSTPKLARPMHDLAILAAEINPPIGNSLSLAEGLSAFELVIAVENRGLVAERDILLEAWLKDLTSPAGAILLNGRTVLPYLAPGEVEVGRIKAAGVVQLSSKYELEVVIRPAPDESYLGNNSKKYTISVTLPR